MSFLDIPMITGSQKAMDAPKQFNKPVPFPIGPAPSSGTAAATTPPPVTSAILTPPSGLAAATTPPPVTSAILTPPSGLAATTTLPTPPPEPATNPVKVSDELLAPVPPFTPPPPEDEDNAIPPYVLVQYIDSSSLSSVDMNAPFVLVDTKPTGASVPTLKEEDLSAVGLTPTNILAFSAMAVLSAIKQPESCGMLRQYIFELPPAAPGEETANYTINDILGIQIVFIAMINHLFLLARVQNPSLPEFSKGYQERMEAVVEMLEQETTSTDTLFKISTKTVLEPLYNTLHTTYAGPIGSTAVAVKDAVPKPTKPTVTPTENTTRVGVNSPSGVTFYGLLEMIRGTPAAIVENFTNALASEQIIPDTIDRAPSIRTRHGFEGMSLPSSRDPSPEPERQPERQPERPSEPGQIASTVVTADPRALSLNNSGWGGNSEMPARTDSSESVAPLPRPPPILGSATDPTLLPRAEGPRRSIASLLIPDEGQSRSRLQPDEGPRRSLITLLPQNETSTPLQSAKNASIWTTGLATARMGRGTRRKSRSPSKLVSTLNALPENNNAASVNSQATTILQGGKRRRITRRNAKKIKR